jgi:hypothetical protein
LFGTVEEMIEPVSIDMPVVELSKINRLNTIADRLGVITVAQIDDKLHQSAILSSAPSNSQTASQALGANSFAGIVTCPAIFSLLAGHVDLSSGDAPGLVQIVEVKSSAACFVKQLSIFT